MSQNRMKGASRLYGCALIVCVLALWAAVPFQAAARSAKSRAQVEALKGANRLIAKPGVNWTTETTWTLKFRHRCPLPKPGDRPTTGSQPSTRTLTMAQRFDLLWLKSNIQLHKRMIKLAQIESEQTTSTELKTFSLDLQTSLALESAQMEAWLKTWYDQEPTTCTQAITSTRDPLLGRPFDADLAFLNQVIWFERSTIASARCATNAAYHEELKTFAGGLIAEGKQVLTLVVAWQELLIKIELEDFFHRGGHWPPPWGGH